MRNPFRPAFSKYDNLSYQALGKQFAPSTKSQLHACLMLRFIIPRRKIGYLEDEKIYLQLKMK